MTPLRWLHATVLLAGRASELTENDLDQMQPAAPIIAALGRSLSAREVTIDKLSLVIQHGPALSWDWRPVGTAHLGQQGGIERAFSPRGETQALNARRALNHPRDETAARATRRAA